LVECTCKKCGTKFEEFESRIAGGRGIYCSQDCHYGIGREERNCACGCGRTFIVKKSSPKRFFSKNCWYRFGWETRICLQCGQEFQIKKSRCKNGRGKFHNEECARLHYRLHPEERAQKISNARIGHKKGEEQHRKLSIANVGKILPEEQKKKISETNKKILSDPEMIKRTVHFGADNGMWNNGSSFFPYPPDFNQTLKSEVLDYHDDHCAICNKTSEENGRDLPIHHIDYNKMNCQPDNLIPLCDSCHGKTIPKERHEYYIKLCTELKQKMTSQS
jgi:hypothetical protein